MSGPNEHPIGAYFQVPPDNERCVGLAYSKFARGSRRCTRRAHCPGQLCSWHHKSQFEERLRAMFLKERKAK